MPQNLQGTLRMFSGRRLMFGYDKKGEIDRVAIPLEPVIDDIVFARAKKSAAQPSSP